MNGTAFQRLSRALAALAMILVWTSAPAPAQPTMVPLSSGGLVPQTAFSPTDRNACFAACLREGHGWRLCKAACYGTGAEF